MDVVSAWVVSVWLSMGMVWVWVWHDVGAVSAWAVWVWHGVGAVSAWAVWVWHECGVNVVLYNMGSVGMARAL